MGNSEENRYHFENHSEAAPRQERVEWHHTGDGNDFTPRDRKPAKEKKHIGRKILTVAAVAAIWSANTRLSTPRFPAAGMRLWKSFLRQRRRRAVGFLRM